MPGTIADPFVADHYIEFPPIDLADEEGLVAYGGYLSTSMLLSAYAQGIFPWFNDDHDHILWWSPHPRMILYPGNFNMSKSLKQTIRSKKFEVRVNTCFKDVIANCARTKRKGQDGTWITPNMQAAYIRLHELGYAHSFETFYNQELVGGLYGVSIGRVFFGESMFHRVSDASKVALHELVQSCKKYGIEFIDVQQSTSHLKKLGGVEEERNNFLKMLSRAMDSDSVFKAFKTS